MAFFPQLSTGAMSQLPLQRRQLFRTIVNTLSDGSEVRSLDPFGAALGFALQFNGLTDAEMDAIEEFFLTQEGRRGTFGFLDPAFNLLCWSEDFGRSAWTAGPLLAMNSSQADPWGTERATTFSNVAVAPQSIVQTLNAPGDYSYSFSVWLRSLTGDPVTLLASSGGYTQTAAVIPTSSWQRFHLAVSVPSGTDSIGFGLELSPGATVHAVGAQVDAQPAPAAYRRSTSRHGIYPHVRFAMDSLSRTTYGPNNHSTTVSLITRAI